MTRLWRAVWRATEGVRSRRVRTQGTRKEGRKEGSVCRDHDEVHELMRMGEYVSDRGGAEEERRRGLFLVFSALDFDGMGPLFPFVRSIVSR